MAVAIKYGARVGSPASRGENNQSPPKSRALKLGHLPNGESAAPNKDQPAKSSLMQAKNRQARSSMAAGRSKMAETFWTSASSPCAADYPRSSSRRSREDSTLQVLTHEEWLYLSVWRPSRPSQAVFAELDTSGTRSRPVRPRKFPFSAEVNTSQANSRGDAMRDSRFAREPAKRRRNGGSSGG